MDKVTICNMAIGWVGGNLITSFDDESVEADICREQYDLTRDLVLEYRDWTFAATRDSMTPLTGTPIGWSYQFQLPSDCLVVRKVTDSAETLDNKKYIGLVESVDFVKESNRILANRSTIYIKYTKKVTNEAIFSPRFIFALANKMAANLALPVTQNSAVKDKFEGMAQVYMDEGGAIDGTQSMPGRARASRIVNARRR